MRIRTDQRRGVALLIALVTIMVEAREESTAQREAERISSIIRSRFHVD